MKVEVLISTMRQKDHTLTQKMNLNSDAIIINQADKNDYYKYSLNHLSIEMFTVKDRGLSKSRNLAILKSKGDICVLADDDVIYEKDYVDTIKAAYNQYSEADIIVFQVERFGDHARAKSYSGQKKWLKYIDTLKVSSVEITFKRKSIQEANVSFNENLGAGSMFTMGEENTFLFNCLKKGLKILYLPKQIAKVDCSESSWFNGYDENYLISKGASFYCMSSKYYTFLILQFALRKVNLFEGINFTKAMKLMLKGVNDYKKISLKKAGK